MISADRLEKALTYLASTDQDLAELKVQVERKEYICKTVRARMFLAATGNNEERKAKAEIDPETTIAEEERFSAEANYERLKAKRVTEALIVDVWRTLEASRRAGNLT